MRMMMMRKLHRLAVFRAKNCELCSCNRLPPGLFTISHRSYTRDPAPSSAVPHREKLLQVERGEVPAMADHPEYPEIVPPPYATGPEAEIHADRLEKAEIEALGTIDERLAALNPYERPFTRTEERYWRPWHAKQIAPRKAWRLPTPTPIYNSLPFYQFATKTAVAPVSVSSGGQEGEEGPKNPQPFAVLSSNSLVPVDENLDLSDSDSSSTPNAELSPNDQASLLRVPAEAISDRMLDRIRARLEDKIQIELECVGSGKAEGYSRDDHVRVMIRHLMETVLEEAQSGSGESDPGFSGPPGSQGNFGFLADSQLDLNARLESFWIRGGYRGHYPTGKDALDEDGKPFTTYEKYIKYDRLVGDTLGKRGELAFCHRANLAAQLRFNAPLQPILPGLDHRAVLSDHPDFAVPEYNYYPSVLGFEPDSDVLWMLPGYEFGDSEDFSSVIAVSAPEQSTYMDRWLGRDRPEEETEALMAVAIATGFSSLLGQAHFLGFTQYHPLTYPLSSSVLVSMDGQHYYTYRYQLNTIDLGRDWRDDGRMNAVWDLGVRQLYTIEEEKEDHLGAEGVGVGARVRVDPESLRFFTRLLLEDPCMPSVPLRPYLPKVKVQEDEEKADTIVAKYANL